MLRSLLEVTQINYFKFVFDDDVIRRTLYKRGFSIIYNRSERLFEDVT